MTPRKQIRITTYPRIHVSLIGMNEGGYRINGGAGFSIGSPCLTVSSETSNTCNVVDLRQDPFSTEEIARIKNSINAAMVKHKLGFGVSINIKGSMLTHSGFGSSTAVRLACIESLMLHNDLDLPNSELVHLSGRGGTSGVGINTYFNGGFVLDVGRKTDISKLLPSHGAEDRRDLPLAIRCIQAPEWEIGVCIPLCIKPLSEEEESTFFSTACPIDTKFAYEASYHVSYGLLASILETDKDTFALSTNNLQACEWKRLERANYGEKLVAIEDELRSRGAIAVGMSSLGPCLFFMNRGEINPSDYMCGILSECQIYKTKINNSGRGIEVVQA